MSKAKIILTICYLLVIVAVIPLILFILRFSVKIPIKVFGEYPFLHDFIQVYSPLILIGSGILTLVFAKRRYKLIGILFIVISIAWYIYLMKIIEAKNF